MTDEAKGVEEAISVLTVLRSAAAFDPNDARMSQEEKDLCASAQRGLDLALAALAQPKEATLSDEVVERAARADADMAAALLEGLEALANTPMNIDLSVWSRFAFNVQMIAKRLRAATLPTAHRPSREEIEEALREAFLAGADQGHATGAHANIYARNGMDALFDKERLAVIPPAGGVGDWTPARAQSRLLTAHADVIAIGDGSDPESPGEPDGTLSYLTSLPWIESALAASHAAFMKAIETPPKGQEAEGWKATDTLLRHMVTRFLSWRLPENFNPDGGISFARLAFNGAPYPMPVGTNLLDQAEAMVRYMLDGRPEHG